MILLFLDEIGTWEIFAIILIVIILFGPKKIPEIARGLGRGMRMMKDATDDIKREILKETDAINPVKSIKEEIQSATKTITESTQNFENPTAIVEEKIKDLAEDLGSVKR